MPSRTKPTAADVAATRESLADDLRSQVETLRDQIADAQDQLEALDEAGLPKDEFLRNVEAWIGDQGSRFGHEAAYGLSALRLASPRPADVEFGKIPVRGGGASAEVLAVADASGLLCWLVPDLLLERARAAIESSNYVEGPPSAERPRMRRELRATLDRLELREEALILGAAAAGVQIPRRPDVRPEIVLSLTLSEAA